MLLHGFDIIKGNARQQENKQEHKAKIAESFEDSTMVRFEMEENIKRRISV